MGHFRNPLCTGGWTRAIPRACSHAARGFLPLQVYVLKRPHVDEFLQRMGQLFECVLFTASLAKVRPAPALSSQPLHPHPCLSNSPLVRWGKLFLW